MSKKETFTEGEMIVGTLKGISGIAASDGSGTWIRAVINHDKYGHIMAFCDKSQSLVKDLEHWRKHKGEELTFIYEGETEPNAKGNVYPRFTVIF